MPHSSGGGSHGGGCHGGSHGGSHGGRSGPRMSNRYFTGARRFRYHDRNGLERYIYGERMPVRMSKGSLIFSLIFMIPFLLAGIAPLFAIFQTVKAPSKLNGSYAVPDTYIEDYCNIIEDETTLNMTLDAFREKTGICPYVVTVHDSDWKGSCSNLEDAAYNFYVNNFKDEDHFLILYSIPDNVEEGAFVDWAWEGMQGDNTDYIITEAHFEKFQQDFHGQLVDGVSLEDALISSFSSSLTYMMDKPESGGTPKAPVIMFCLIWYSMVGVFIFSIVKSYKSSQVDYEEVPLEGNDSYAGQAASVYPNNYYHGVPTPPVNANYYGQQQASAPQTNYYDQAQATMSNASYNDQQQASSSYFDNVSSAMNDDSNDMSSSMDSEYRTSANNAYTQNGLKDPYANRRGKNDLY